MSLLTVKDLSVSFHVGDRVVEAVKKASFTIEKGQTFALVSKRVRLLPSWVRAVQENR
jgi:ABC-type microcin C transport system duplicated ATPase subunit YejF